MDPVRLSQDRSYDQRGRQLQDQPGYEHLEGKPQIPVFNRQNSRLMMDVDEQVPIKVVSGKSKTTACILMVDKVGDQLGGEESGLCDKEACRNDDK